MPLFRTGATRTTPTSSGVPTTPLDTLRDQLIDPLSNVGKPIGSGLIKAIGGIKKTGESLHKAKKDWHGDESVYNLDQDGQVQETIRGVDTEDANGFKKDLARDNLKKGVHAGIKTIHGAGKSAAKSMGGVGKVWSLASEVTDSINPLKAASQLASGTHKMIQSGEEAIRLHSRKKAARKGQELAEKENNPLAMGLKSTKRGISRSRNDAIAETGLGALETTTGGLGIAQYVDPTGGTFIAHKVMSGVTKLAKKGHMVRTAIRDGMRSEKVMEMRQKADQGDPKAMKWMMENDPRMASTQLLMRSQEGSEESKSFAQEHVAKTLGLSKDAKKELATGKLSEFDKLYSNRTGQDIESKLGVKEAGIYKFFRPAAQGIRKGWKGLKSRFKGKDKAPTTPDMSSNDVADQFTALTQLLDAESDKKKQVGPNLSHDDMDQVWGGPTKLDKQFMPDRGLAEVREYKRVKDWRVQKTYGELVDKAEQKSLKERFKGSSDGALFNMDSYDNATDAIDKTQELLDAPEGFLDKVKGVSSGIESSIAKKIGPWADTGEVPQDIRQGMIDIEQRRRESGQTSGKNLSTTAPVDPQWKEKQEQAKTTRKELRSQQKEAGTLPPQLAKKRAEEQKKQLAEQKKREKEQAKLEKKRLAEQKKKLKKSGW